MKIIFVDDDPVQLDSFRLMLHEEENLKIAGLYADPGLAYDELEAVMPDVMVTDIGMPNMSGIELIKKSKAKLPEMEIILGGIKRVSGWPRSHGIRRSNRSRKSRQVFG